MEFFDIRSSRMMLAQQSHHTYLPICHMLLRIVNQLPVFKRIRNDHLKGRIADLANADRIAAVKIGHHPRPQGMRLLVGKHFAFAG
ncbi:MAG: hypothetical protein AAAB11_07305, partial [Rhizobium giardinii]